MDLSLIKRPIFGKVWIPIVLISMLLMPAWSVAQQRPNTLKAPAAPTPIENRERTIQDLLYYPFSCIDAPMTTRESAWQIITDTFGSCETINGSPGLHANGSFDFSYRDETIGICFYDWIDTEPGMSSSSGPRWRPANSTTAW